MKTYTPLILVALGILVNGVHLVVNLPPGYDDGITGLSLGFIIAAIIVALNKKNK